MLKRTMLTAAMLTLMAGPALAFHCPKDAAAIDHGLANMTVSDDVKSQVTALRDKGLEQHKAGDHQAATGELAEGMRVLLMSTKK